MPVIRIITPVLLLLTVFFQMQEIKGALTVMPVVKKFCEYDAFIASTPYNGKVFLHPWKKVDRRADWFEARGYCAEHCAQLVTIQSDDENTFFLTFMRSVGLTFPGVWIGAEVVNRTEFTNWSNGEIANYHNKAPSEYNESDLTCINAAYNINANLWYNSDCFVTTYYVACQRLANWTICE